MEGKKFSCLLVLAVVLLFSSVSLAAVPVEVTVGKEVIITLEDHRIGKRVSIADCEVADIRSICGMSSKGQDMCVPVMRGKCEVESPGKSGGAKTPKGLASITKVIINGKKPGVTSLIVWYKDEEKKEKETFFDVIVLEKKGDDIERAFENRLDGLRADIQSLAPNDKIDVKVANDTILLVGEAQNQQTIDKVVQLANAYAIASEIVTTKNYTVEGMKETVSTSGKVLNHISIREAQQVMLEVKVAQINKNKLKELGVGIIMQGIGGNNAEATFPGLTFAPSGNMSTLDITETQVLGVGPTGESIVVDRFLGKSDLFPGITGFDLDSNTPQIGITHFPSGITALLRALQEKGFGKILAEPNMIVRSGEQGHFHVGSRIPIQTVLSIGGAATVSIIYEEVGVRLIFGPQVMESGIIRLKVDPAEVSSVARFLTFQGIVAPEIDTRTVRTSVDLREGESLILAGLLSEEMRKNIQKVPILGDVPILGALFRNTRDELEQTELVFFITPKLVKPIAPGTTTPLPTDNRPTPEEEKHFRWIPNPWSNPAPEGK